MHCCRTPAGLSNGGDTGCAAAGGGGTVAEDGFTAALAQDLDPADVRAVVAVFLRDVARLVAEVDDAVARGDADACYRGGHALAGAASAVGAGALESACRRMMAAATGDGVARVTAARKVDREAAAAIGEAERFLASLPP
jgi:hypothetical protein